MLSVIDMVTVSLGPSLTYARRTAYWFPASEEDVASDPKLVGTLRIELQGSVKSTAKIERDEYRVRHVDPGMTNLLGYHLAHVEDLDRSCLCRPKGAVMPVLVDCTCKAGMCGVSESCKHRDALAKLIEVGAI